MMPPPTQSSLPPSSPNYIFFFVLRCFVVFLPFAVYPDSDVAKRWPTLTEKQRLAWVAVAATLLSKPRLGHCGPLTGCQLFVKINVPRVRRGDPQLDLPPARTDLGCNP